jgi:polyisoprenoid-binding protein YceI
MKRLIPLIAVLGLGLTAGAVQAEPQAYEIEKSHTFIAFKISHIGYAWMPGVFKEFSGELTYDPENRSNSEVSFTVKTPSVDTFHSERDKHIREKEGLLYTTEYPKATFESTSYEPTGHDSAILTGDLTIKGKTHEVEFEVEEGKAAEDPWDNFRRSFTATGKVNLKEFGITHFEGMDAPKYARLEIAVEALRK